MNKDIKRLAEKIKAWKTVLPFQHEGEITKGQFYPIEKVDKLLDAIAAEPEYKEVKSKRWQRIDIWICDDSEIGACLEGNCSPEFMKTHDCIPYIAHLQPIKTKKKCVKCGEDNLSYQEGQPIAEFCDFRFEDKKQVCLNCGTLLEPVEKEPVICKPLFSGGIYDNEPNCSVCNPADDCKTVEESDRDWEDKTIAKMPKKPIEEKAEIEELKSIAKHDSSFEIKWIRENRDKLNELTRTVNERMGRG